MSGKAANPRRESSGALGVLFFCIILMGIYDPNYLPYPTQGFTGGGEGGSGGGGASGEWIPDFPMIELCDDIIATTYPLLAGYYVGRPILGCPDDYFPEYDNTAWIFEGNNEGVALMRCYGGIGECFEIFGCQLHYGNHPEWVSPIGGTRTDYEGFWPLIQGTYLEYPFDSQQELCFNLDDPEVSEAEIYRYGVSRVQALNEPGWLKHADYTASHADDLTGNYAAAAIGMTWFSCPFPFFSAMSRGVEILTPLVFPLSGQPLATNAIPLLDFVLRNAKRVRKHKLSDRGNKEII